MADATPKTFEPKERGGSVSFDGLKVHRAIETDKAGLSTVHIWVTGRAVSHDEDPFQALVADVAFSIFDKDKLLGICSTQSVMFDRNEQSQPVTADEGLRIGLDESVTHIEAQVEVTKTIKSSRKLTFEME